MTTEQDAAELAERVEEALRGDEGERAAGLAERLDRELREAFFSVLSTEEMAELMEYLDGEVRGVVTARMPRVTLARVLDRTSNDVAVDVLRTLPPSDMARVLSSMATAHEITPLLEHADESAGGLMTRGYVALHPEMTVHDAITFLRLRKPLAAEAYSLYVLGESQPEDARWVLAKEGAIGLVKGIVFGLLIGVIAWAWQGEPAWGLVVGVALLLNMLMAGLLGAVIPLTLRALRLDPAIASGIFLTAFTDALGFLFLLGLGTLLISQLKQEKIGG